MTEDKRKKIEACFDSVEKLVSLRRTLTESLSYVTNNLDYAILKLEMNQSGFKMIEGELELENADIEAIIELYSESLWDTIQNILPHYRTLVK